MLTFCVQNLNGEAKVTGPDVADDNVEVLCLEGACIVLFFCRGSRLLGLLVVVRPDLNPDPDKVMTQKS